MSLLSMLGPRKGGRVSDAMAPEVDTGEDAPAERDSDTPLEADTHSNSGICPSSGKSSENTLLNMALGMSRCISNDEKYQLLRPFQFNFLLQVDRPTHFFCTLHLKMK